MQKKREVMRQSVSLVETIQEGLVHIQQQLNEGGHGTTISLFEDIVYAYERVESSLQGLDEGMVSEEAKTLQVQIVKGLDAAVHAYEANSFGKVQEVLQFTLVPTFKKWHDRLDLDFGKYLAN